VAIASVVVVGVCVAVRDRSSELSGAEGFSKGVVVTCSGWTLSAAVRFHTSIIARLWAWCRGLWLGLMECILGLAGSGRARNLSRSSM